MYDLLVTTERTKFRPIRYHDLALSDTDVKIFQTYEVYSAHPAIVFFRRVQGFLQDDRGYHLEGLTQTDVAVSEPLAFFLAARDHL
jgi:hypothetical protein